VFESGWVHSFSKSGIFLEQSREGQNTVCLKFNSSLNIPESESPCQEFDSQGMYIVKIISGKKIKPG
jgi:hypothetical protein